MVSLGAPVCAAAQEPAPSQEVAVDREPSGTQVAITADPLGAAFGDWALQLSATLAPAHSVYVEPRWLEASWARGAGLELGYRVHPLSDGLNGLFLGVGLGAAIDGVVDPAVTGWAGADAGWSFVWGGLLIGASVGIGWIQPFHDQRGAGVALRVDVALGWVFE